MRHETGQRLNSFHARADKMCPGGSVAIECFERSQSLAQKFVQGGAQGWADSTLAWGGAHAPILHTFRQSGKGQDGQTGGRISFPREGPRPRSADQAGWPRTQTAVTEVGKVLPA